LLVGFDPLAGSITGYDARDGTRRFRQPGREYPPPTLADAACVFRAPGSDDAGKIVALDPATGELLWESPLRGIVGAGDRIVTVGKSSVGLHQARDGSVLWRTEVAGDVGGSFGPAAWLGEHVYVHVSNRDRPDELVAIGREGGDIEWRRTVGRELKRVLATPEHVVTASSVSESGGGVVIRLDAFAPAGSRRWETTTEISIGGTVETLGRAGGVLLAGSDREIAAYEPTSGARQWRHDPDGRISVATSESALYVSYRDQGRVARLPT
jgi:outer membrane protein assembly factor BamB